MLRCQMNGGFKHFTIAAWTTGAVRFAVRQFPTPLQSLMTGFRIPESGHGTAVQLP